MGAGERDGGVRAREAGRDRGWRVGRESGKRTDLKLKIPEGHLQSLVSSIMKSLERVKINVFQNRRLSLRIEDIVAKLKTVPEGGALAMQHWPFAILLGRASSLVAECGRSKCVKTALVRGNNKEAYKEMHEEITKLITHARLSSIMDGKADCTTPSSPPEMEHLNEDAEKDLQEMLQLPWKFRCRYGSRFCLVFMILWQWQCRVGSLLGRTTSESRWEKIVKVISDKSKDQASSNAGERDISASYLFSESEIDRKKLIGTGSYGDVYRATWLGCEMCYKNFPWSGGYSEEWLKQARPLLKLRHPNVLQLVGFSQSTVDSQESKVLTEIMQGDIRSLIDRRMKERNGEGTPFNWYMTLDIMTQVVRGLACMHNNKFMHGDRVLTTNIIIKECREYVVARIGDFGVPVSIPVEYVHVYEPRLGDPTGAETARWMAPEVCTGAKLYSTSSDIYSYGIFCYELLTGKIPFYKFKDVAEVHSQIVAGTLRPELPEKLDMSVKRLIQQCWDVNPLSRPTAQKIVDQLEEIQVLVTPAEAVSF